MEKVRAKAEWPSRGPVQLQFTRCLIRLSAIYDESYSRLSFMSIVSFAWQRVSADSVMNQGGSFRNWAGLTVSAWANMGSVSALADMDCKAAFPLICPRFETRGLCFSDAKDFQ
ncbi:hypothetical protein CEE69_30990 [Rhodopirellula bahusiensis]|uniref:Uncharacterized protein n=1 Tax=Rhodopirellula bahusiensis TaxID=2014065 RepID=A0A2G1VXC7_9BACT|nr:hypothetical protein CEE69_30990 [Rhodopirellula bahusiensis]